MQFSLWSNNKYMFYNASHIVKGCCHLKWLQIIYYMYMLTDKFITVYMNKYILNKTFICTCQQLAWLALHDFRQNMCIYVYVIYIYVLGKILELDHNKKICGVSSSLPPFFQISTKINQYKEFEDAKGADRNR